MSGIAIIEQFGVYYKKRCTGHQRGEDMAK